MTTLHKWAKTIMMVLLAAMCQSAAASEVVLVVSQKSNIITLTPTQVADIFLGKISTSPNGARVIPIDQQEGSSARETFYHEFIGKTPAQVKTYWSKIVFTGKGYPPIEVAPADRVKRIVRDNPAYIGYIDRHAVDASIKVITVPKD